MNDAERADIERTAREALQEHLAADPEAGFNWRTDFHHGICGESAPYGNDVCTRPAGHRLDRHWSDRLNWPAA